MRALSTSLLPLLMALAAKQFVALGAFNWVADYISANNAFKIRVERLFNRHLGGKVFLHVSKRFGLPLFDPVTSFLSQVFVRILLDLRKLMCKLRKDSLRVVSLA